MFRFNKFLRDEKAAGVVELILIIVVLIGIVLIFKKQLTELVNDIFDTIPDEAGSSCLWFIVCLFLKFCTNYGFSFPAAKFSLGPDSPSEFP